MTDAKIPFLDGSLVFARIYMGSPTDHMDKSAHALISIVMEQKRYMKKVPHKIIIGLNTSKKGNEYEPDGSDRDEA